MDIQREAGSKFPLVLLFTILEDAQKEKLTICSRTIPARGMGALWTPKWGPETKLLERFAFLINYILKMASLNTDLVVSVSPIPEKCARHLTKHKVLQAQPGGRSQSKCCKSVQTYGPVLFSLASLEQTGNA